ncbi:MAG: amidohydrolase [Anaerolineales bacterium]
MSPLFADRLIYANNILTLADGRQSVHGLALRGGRIVACGSRQQLETLANGSTIIDDFGEKTILPGLVDAHIHLAQYALSLGMIDCLTPDLETCLQRVADKAETTPPGTWIQGHGWDQNLWDRWPAAEDLDRVAPHHPVYLTARSLHAAVANSRALRSAGLEVKSPDPPQGKLGRTTDGSLDGVLLEEAAMAMVANTIPAPNAHALADLLVEAQEVLWQLGVIGVHDFDGPDCFRALQILAERGELGLRVLKAIRGEQMEAAIEAGLRSGFGDEWIRIGNVKFFADGALGPRTAAMATPFADDPSNRGILRMDLEEITVVGLKARDAGLGLAVHAIGDRANRVVLDALQTIHTSASPSPALRDRMEHLQLMQPSDLERPAGLDVIASMQPIHATSDMDMASVAWGDRIQMSYAWRSILDSGATLVFGSDAPVENPNPFWGIHAAVTRQSRSHPMEPWVPEQRISLSEALCAYTQGPAVAAGLEAWTGKLLPGYAADLIVLDNNPFEIHPQQLHEVLPIATMVDGQWRYRSA